MEARGRIPLIDLGPLCEDDLEAKMKVADEIDRAFMTVGFCYVQNHGVPQRMIDDAFSAAATFFSLPLEKKNEVAVDSLFRGYTAPSVAVRAYSDYASDGSASENGAIETRGGKEMFNLSFEGQHHDPDSGSQGWVYGPNRWPDFFREFQPAIYSYYEAVSRVGDDVLRGVALALGSNEDFFLSRYGKNTAQCTLLHYPPLEEDEIAAGAVSSPEHCDFSCITLLCQDNVGGLQVRERSTGTWIDAMPIPGTFIINVGDMLARWTNHRYVSTPHRVMNRTGKERYSIGTFYNPNAAAMIDARDLGIADSAVLYPSISAGRYISARFEELYASAE